jgi:predicted enzyme related to lactoylglutathione lyase
MDKVVHFEIPTDDLARAKEFYGSIFGWEIQTMPEFDYTSAQTTAMDDQQRPTEPGAINGGMFQRTPQLPDSPVITVGVESVEIALKEVESHGGSVVTPRTEIPGMGAFAYFKDTEGNVLGLWEVAG